MQSLIKFVQHVCYNLYFSRKKEKLNLSIDWKPFYHMLDSTYFSKFRRATYTPKEYLFFFPFFQNNIFCSHGSAVIDLIGKIRTYFTPNATDEMLDEFRPYFCIHDHLLFKAQGFLCTFIPTTHGRVDWHVELMRIWDWIGIHNIVFI